MKKLITLGILMLSYCATQAQVTDTLGWVKYFQGTESLYESPNGGYAFGNNGYLDKAKAQTFSHDKSFVLRKALLKFGAVEFGSQNLNSAVIVNVYLNNGPGVTFASNSDTLAPDSIIATAALPVSQISENTIMEVDFSSETLVFFSGERFSIGIVLDSLEPGDTLGLVSTTDEDAGETQNAWELTANNNWVVVAQPAYSWNLDVDLGIFAVIDENDPAGVQESASRASLTVYPNPANNQLTIELPKNLRDSDLSWEVSDFSGKVILSETAVNSSLVNVDVSSLESGVYVISIFDELGALTSRFVKY